MKLLKNILISISFLTALVGIISSCGQQEYDRVFRYYFEAELDSAYTRIRKAVEGEEEGLYRVGSKAIYQYKADSLKEIGMSEYASQENIDYAYLGLLAAKDVFEDSKNPFVSSLKELIAECHFTLENTVEGTLPGQFKPGAKDSLKISVELAEAILETSGLTQRIIDRECETLIHALNRYDTFLIGDFVVNVENAGFEKPGSNQTNFNRIDGWSCAGMLNNWTKTKPGTVKAGAVNLPSAPEGNCVMNIGEYSHPVWQRLNERFHSGCTYIVTFKAKINYSNPTPKGDDLETFVRSRIITFQKYDEANPDLSENNIQVIHEMSFSLGVERTMDDFISCEQYFRGSVAPALDGKRMAIQLLSHEGAYKTDGSGNKSVTSSDTWIFVDDIKIVRTTSR